MLRLRVMARTVVVGAALAVGLGCTGAMTGAMNMAGIEMRFGSDAVHPPDFPAMPITDSKKKMSLKMTAQGDQINLPEDIPLPSDMPLEGVVIYDVPASERPDAVGQAMIQVQAAGFEEAENPPQPENEIKEIFVSTSDKAVFAIVGSESGEESTVVFVRLAPHVEPPAPDAKPKEAPAPDQEDEGGKHE